MSATIIIPDVNLSNRSHILAKDSTAVKYVSKVKIQEEINVIMARIKFAKANIIAPQKEVKSKTDLMDLYGYLYRGCEKYNAKVLAERQAKVEQESAERALKSHKCLFIQHFPDYWGGGSGDVFFFLKNFASSDELDAWA